MIADYRVAIETFSTIHGELMDWLEQMKPRESEKWERIMAHHPFSQEDWESARKRLVSLLTKEERMVDDSSLLSYLDCCAESVGSVHPLPDFADLVEEFFQKYGMDS